MELSVIESPQGALDSPQAVLEQSSGSYSKPKEDHNASKFLSNNNSYHIHLGENLRKKDIAGIFSVGNANLGSTSLVADLRLEDRPSASTSIDLNGRSIKFIIPEGLDLSEEELLSIMKECADDKQEAMACIGPRLTSLIIGKGYTTSKVVTSSGDQSIVTIIPGIIQEVEITAANRAALSAATEIARAFKGDIFCYPKISRAIRHLKTQFADAQIYINNRLVDANSMATVLEINVEVPASRWHGKLSVSNDGGGLTGEMRPTGMAFKENIFRYNDLFLIYGEFNIDSELESGLTNGYAYYKTPLNSFLEGTIGLGGSKQQWVEFARNDPYHGTRFEQFYYLFGLKSPLATIASQQVNIEVSLASVANNAFSSINHYHILPGISNRLGAAYLSTGLSTSGVNDMASWNLNLIAKQGIKFLTRKDDLKNLVFYNIDPAQSRAIFLGGDIHLQISKNVALKSRLEGQYAFQPLLPSMEFILGSDTGLLGYPALATSADNGILSVTQIDINLARWGKTSTLSLSPYLGYGAVKAASNSFGQFRESLMSAGLLVGLRSSHWMLELGWIQNLSSADFFERLPRENSLLKQGIFTRVEYQF